MESIKVYKDKEKIIKIYKELFNRLLAHNSISKKIEETKVIVEIILSDLNTKIFIDTVNTPQKIITDIENYSLKPTLTIITSSTIAHKFWLGTLNVLLALFKKDIIVKGAIEYVLFMLPFLNPAFKIYKQLIAEFE